LMRRVSLVMNLLVAHSKPAPPALGPTLFFVGPEVVAAVIAPRVMNNETGNEVSWE